MPKKRASTLDRTLKESLILMQKHKGSMSLQTFFASLAKRGAVFIVMIFSLPFCLPFHIPGLSTPFGIVIALLGFQIAFGRRIWLPKFVLSKKISSAFLKKMLKKSLKVIKKVSPWIYPRWLWMSSHSLMKVCNGLMIVLLGGFLALPLPIPTTNLGVAWPLLLISLGLLENDGLFIFLGYFFALFYFSILTTLIFFR